MAMTKIKKETEILVSEIEIFLGYYQYCLTELQNHPEKHSLSYIAETLAATLNTKRIFDNHLPLLPYDLLEETIPEHLSTIKWLSTLEEETLDLARIYIENPTNFQIPEHMYEETLEELDELVLELKETKMVILENGVVVLKIF